MTQQRKGKDHMRYINRIAKTLWRKSSYLHNYDDCLMKAMELHRKKMVKVSKTMRMADPYFSRNIHYYHPTSPLND